MSYVSAVSYGGSSLTRIGTSGGGNTAVDLWSMLDPSVGTETVTVTLNESMLSSGQSLMSDAWAAGSISYLGVGEIHSVPESFASASGSGDPNAPEKITFSYNIPTEDIIVDAFATFLGSSATVMAGSGQSQRWAAGPLAVPLPLPGGGYFSSGGSDEPALSSPVSVTWASGTSLPYFIPNFSWIGIALDPPTAVIPEYPPGLLLLAILMMFGHGLMKRGTRTRLN